MSRSPRDTKVHTSFPVPHARKPVHQEIREQHACEFTRPSRVVATRALESPVDDRAAAGRRRVRERGSRAFGTVFTGSFVLAGTSGTCSPSTQRRMHAETHRNTGA